MGDVISLVAAPRIEASRPSPTADILRQIGAEGTFVKKLDRERRDAHSLSDKMAYSIDEFCHIAGIGRNTTYLEIRRGKLRARKVGRRTIITGRDAADYLDNLPLAPAPEATP
jgi:hypothetical protein